MMQMPESKHKLYAAVLLFVALLILLFMVALPMFAFYSSSKEEVASLQHRLSQYKTISRKTSGLSNKLSKLEAFNEDQEYYFAEGKAALVSAELQGIVKEVLSTQGAKILSTQPVTSGNQDERQIKVSVHCRADIISLRNLMYELESHVPVLIIDKINIGRGFRTTFRNQQSNGSDTLDVRFDVSGFLAAQVDVESDKNNSLDSQL
ncbi:MAG: type II secretion system protein GspM [Gammaproteobacteria bacterium]